MQVARPLGVILVGREGLTDQPTATSARKRVNAIGRDASVQPAGTRHAIPVPWGARAKPVLDNTKESILDLRIHL